jgi:hypothetical protein
MTRQRRIVLLFGVLTLLVGLGVGLWIVMHRGTVGTQADAQQAAEVAAELPMNRAAAVDPELPDDPKWVPSYPAGTSMVLDQSTWVPIGESASAYAQVEPAGTRVMVYFRRHKGHWYVSEIGTGP